VIIIRTSDSTSPLGRLDYASLSQQALMELLIGGITNKDKIYGQEDVPELTGWGGVFLNENGEVHEIGWNILMLQGSIELKWVPSTVQKLLAYVNDLCGSVDLRGLPEGMKVLSLAQNQLTGELSLEHLPSTFETLALPTNSLSGSLNLKSLPKSLKWLFLDRNNFSGTIDMSKLPDRLEEINLNNNPISGETDFSHLPKSLRKLDISNTDLTGEVLVDGSLTAFNASDCQVKYTKNDDSEPQKSFLGQFSPFGLPQRDGWDIRSPFGLRQASAIPVFGQQSGSSSSDQPGLFINSSNAQGFSKETSHDTDE